MVKEQRVRIVADSDSADPRDWDCHAGRMICWHNSYNLGDKHEYTDPVDFQRELACEAVDGLEEELDRLENDVLDKLYDRAIDRGYAESRVFADGLVGRKVDKLITDAVCDGYVILPLYLFDHSGITISTSPFDCRWDSGQVGWIICDKETIDREFGGDRDLAKKCLEAEVATYDDYLTDNVYGFIVEDRDENDDSEWEHVDSCFGFYGSDVRQNGMADHLGEELTELAESAEIEC